MITKKEPLEKCVMDWCYVKLKFNKQGLPIKKSKNYYEQGKSIYFWSPEDGRVAMFRARSNWAGLLCDENPDNLTWSLGVFACIESVPQNVTKN